MAAAVVTAITAIIAPIASINAMRRNVPPLSYKKNL